MTIEQWAKQFPAITVSDIDNFLETVDNDLSLHDKKRLFTEKYQDKIAFSYTLQEEKNIVKDLHIEKIEEEFRGGYGNEYGFVYRDEHKPGEGYGNEYGEGYK